jgi:glucose-6-phosphate isomerase
MINQSKAWKKLTAEIKKQKVDLKKAFAESSKRAQDFSIATTHIFYDFSRQLINQNLFDLLLELANEAGLKGKVQAMFAGEEINRTENRSVLHVSLRSEKNKEVKDVLKKIEKFSGEIHSGKKLKNIVSIGIGGSCLGPEYLAEACKPYAKEGMKLVFVANVDGTDFATKTAGLNPEETLFVIVSKTFTTAETMMNAKTAKKWMLDGLKGKASEADIIKKHFVAVSTAKEKVEAFGIDSENMFIFWDWVGGRFSATSAVGMVPLSLYLGFENAREILKGAHWMDNHCQNEPIEKNIPVICALLDILNINFYNLTTRALLPYSQLLAKLPAHTQQVEMESNGKSVDLNGKQVEFCTGEVVFGEPGTNGQHSFYQEIHQGQVIPCDFIGFIKPSYKVGETTKDSVDHHHELMTNFLAQPDALAFGKKSDDPARNFSGNRPSSSLLLHELTPFTAGLLLAWTEHRAATKGFIWGINSFDQFGVELGKKLGVATRNAMLGDKEEVEKFNPSTRKIFDAIMSGRLPS